MVDFGRFRRKSDKESCERHKFEAMVTNATSFCKVKHRRLNKIIDVNLMFNSKEFIHEVALYTMRDNLVELGDYVEYGDKIILLTHKLESVKGDGILDRFKGLVCNYSVEVNGTLMPAFVSFNINKTVMAVKEETVITNTLSAFAAEGAAIMIISNWHNVQPNQNYMIGSRQWRLKDYDDITSPSVVYMTLENVLATIPAQPAIPLEFLEEDVDPNTLAAGAIYKIPTERAFFKANRKVEIVELTPTYARVKIPYGITDIEFTVLEYNNETKKAYIVKGV